ncbi:EAL domain-containing protein [Ottowia sp.]|uniref:putative bifunctional diguanylate cyclase/phosphodiesterase n=1 Tax=Ottowia sp. TaxID=1898956 RepID=UPI0025CD1474|nr:EAL domain-containing protein [Ottowia sp.]MBK6616348.1 EAL domain-containing protein [Ottowia sp.]
MYIELDPTLNPVVWIALALAGCGMAAQLALSWVELVPRSTTASGAARLAGSGASMGTGLWIAHAALESLQGPGTTYLHYSVVAEAFFWFFSVILSSLALMWSETEFRGRQQWKPAAAFLGASIAVLHVVSSSLAAGLGHAYTTLAVTASAAAICAGGATFAFWILRRFSGTDRRTLGMARTAASSVWAVSMLGGLSLPAMLHTNMPGAPATAVAAAYVPLTALGSVGPTVILYILRILLRLHVRTYFVRLHESRKRGEQALVDPLTRLCNRHRFEGTIAEAAQHADEKSEQFALLLVGIDGCKLVNQTFGYSEGDAVICEVSRRLRILAKPQMVGRLSGDQFLVLLPGPIDTRDASSFATRLLGSISKPFDIAGTKTNLTASIGIAMYPEHGAVTRLIAHAEAALSCAKNAGGATHSFFDAHLVNRSREQSELLRDLRAALDRSELQLYYQPKIHAASGEVSSAEALIRWHHPQRGMVSPSVFIPLAERYGLINILGKWVIGEACRQARLWRDSGMRMRIAINLSVQQLRQHDLAEQISSALRLHQINPDLITCEITESSAMEDTTVTAKILHQLDQIGVHISIDDFGTGHSSLSYLRKLPADELKIDRSFVQDLETSEDARKVASAVINLAKALDLKVVAEGVETEGQNLILRQLGCDQLQGYLFAKPMSATALGEWAIHDVGPRTLSFSSALFKHTQPMEFDDTPADPSAGRAIA